MHRVDCFEWLSVVNLIQLTPLDGDLLGARNSSRCQKHAVFFNGLCSYDLDIYDIRFPFDPVPYRKMYWSIAAHVVLGRHPKLHICKSLCFSSTI